jgi:hypothetical protein
VGRLFQGVRTPRSRADAILRSNFDDHAPAATSFQIFDREDPGHGTDLLLHKLKDFRLRLAVNQLAALLSTLDRNNL